MRIMANDAKWALFVVLKILARNTKKKASMREPF